MFGLSKRQLLVACAVFVTIGLRAADFKPIWVARYKGSGLGVQVDDRAQAFALDKEGNIYVTGSSDGVSGTPDFATVRYDSNGTQVWVARYDTPGSGYDKASQIVVDNAGNVYVSGQTSGNNGIGDYLTVKHDPNGNVLWASQFDGPDHYHDQPSQMIVDGSGNVYVTGTSYQTDSVSSLATVKYDSEGNQIWAAYFGGPAMKYQGGTIMFDSAGNVCVTGLSSDARQIPDLLTLKYEGNGNQIAVVRYRNPGDLGVSTWTFGGAGNLVASGVSSISPYGYETVNYDTNAVLKWIARYVGPVSWESVAGVTTDSNGNVYVTGSSAGHASIESDSDDLLTVKYDSNGNQLWASRFNGPQDGNDVAANLEVDRWGNVFVAGAIDGFFGNYDFAVLKHDSNGNRLWIARYHGSYASVPAKMALDEGGNIYLAGTTFTDPVSREDYEVIKFANASVSGLPEIIRPPQSQVVPVGTNATLSVSVEGLGPFSYQWRRNGSILPGETRSNAMTVAYHSNPVREYYVEVSNAAGTVTSPIARVNFAPTLSSVAMLTNYKMRFTIPWMADAVSVQASDDLVHWQNLTNFDPSPSVDIQFTNELTNLDLRFYRVVARPLR